MTWALPLSIEDPVHGTILIPPAIKVVLNAPEVQRLRDLHQLGLASYVYPSATHTRFEHSVGCMHLALTMLDTIVQNHRNFDISLPCGGYTAAEAAQMQHHFPSAELSHCATKRKRPATGAEGTGRPGEAAVAADPSVPVMTVEGGLLNSPRTTTSVRQMASPSRKRMATEPNLAPGASPARSSTGGVSGNVKAEEDAVATAAAADLSGGSDMDDTEDDENEAAEDMEDVVNERRNPREVTASDRFCVAMAGLCHDIGHGPLSHTFESLVNENWSRGRGGSGSSRNKKKWEHEEMSMKLVDKIWNDVGGTLRRHYGLTTKDREFVKLMMRGLKDSEPFPLARVGRPAWKRFMVDIVANKSHGLDVDKLDYLQRDCFFVGQRRELYVKRIFQNAFVVPVRAEEGAPSRDLKKRSSTNSSRWRVCPDTPEGTQYRICYSEKVLENIATVFDMRILLHRIVYQHRVVRLMTRMAKDALALCARAQVIPCGERRFTLRQAADDVHAFLNASEWILGYIKTMDCATVPIEPPPPPTREMDALTVTAEQPAKTPQKPSGEAGKAQTETALFHVSPCSATPCTAAASSVSPLAGAGKRPRTTSVDVSERDATHQHTLSSQGSYTHGGVADDDTPLFHPSSSRGGETVDKPATTSLIISLPTSQNTSLAEPPPPPSPCGPEGEAKSREEGLGYEEKERSRLRRAQAILRRIDCRDLYLDVYFTNAYDTEEEIRRVQGLGDRVLEVLQKDVPVGQRLYKKLVRWERRHEGVRALCYEKRVFSYAPREVEEVHGFRHPADIVTVVDPRRMTRVDARLRQRRRRIRLESRCRLFEEAVSAAKMKEKRGPPAGVAASAAAGAEGGEGPPASGTATIFGRVFRITEVERRIRRIRRELAVTAADACDGELDGETSAAAVAAEMDSVITPAQTSNLNNTARGGARGESHFTYVYWMCRMNRPAAAQHSTALGPPAGGAGRHPRGGAVAASPAPADEGTPSLSRRTSSRKLGSSPPKKSSPHAAATTATTTTRTATAIDTVVADEAEDLRLTEADVHHLKRFFAETMQLILRECEATKKPRASG